MAEDRMAVLDMLRKATADGNVDILREGVRVLARRIAGGGYGPEAREASACGSCTR